MPWRYWKRDLGPFWEWAHHKQLQARGVRMGEASFGGWREGEESPLPALPNSAPKLLAPALLAPG